MYEDRYLLWKLQIVVEPPVDAEGVETVQEDTETYALNVTRISVPGLRREELVALRGWKYVTSNIAM